MATLGIVSGQMLDVCVDDGGGSGADPGIGYNSGNGGGASGVSVGSDFSQPAVVAGGGGGAGSATNACAATGGNAGMPGQSAAITSPMLCGISTGGNGGVDTNPGNGGTPGGSNGAFTNAAGPGAGGDGAPGTDGVTSGGGGGGGYAGGGGGGASGDDPYSDASAGGGGSDFCATDSYFTNTTISGCGVSGGAGTGIAAGAGTGDAQVTLSYTAAVTSPPTNASASISSGTNANISWNVPASDGGSQIGHYVVLQSTTGVGGPFTDTANCTTVNWTTTTCMDTGLTPGTTYWFEVVAVNAVGTSDPSNVTGPVVATSPVLPTLPSSNSYWMAGSDGGVFSFGGAHFYGSMGGKHLNAPVVGITAVPLYLGGFVASPRGVSAKGAPLIPNGYWLVAGDGGVFNYGTAAFEGGMGGKHLNAPVVALSPTPTGSGYIEVAQDGGVFAFGDAGFYGSMGNKHLNAPIVGAAETNDGGGYWLVGADGGVFSFGDAAFAGSAVGSDSSPAVGILTNPNGSGYWVARADGSVANFGGAPALGGLPHAPNAPVVGIAANVPEFAIFGAGAHGATPKIATVQTSPGYWMAGADGGVFAFAGSGYAGSMGGKPLAAPIVGIAGAVYTGLVQ